MSQQHRIIPKGIARNDLASIALTMWNELNMAWPHIKPEGICICDNIESNTSFFDFCLKVGKIPLVLPAPGNDGLMLIRFALIKK